ncbi:MAG: glycosyltransferase family 4 protein [Dongiaceae bacterium]
MADATVAPGNAAIFYALDGYDTSRPKLMGRHAAGEGFLRGFARHAAVDRVWGFTVGAEDGKRFRAEMERLRPGTPVSVLNTAQVAKLGEPGAVFLPGPGLTDHSWNRRFGRAQRAYSLCGVTHTTASHGAMDAIAGLLTAPVQRWDAVICTSLAVRKTFDRVLGAQRDYLQARLGGVARATLPELPVIPLGVDCDAFEMKPKTRQAWRSELKIADKDVVLLFMGRLSFHAKAHPFPMYVAAEAAAKAIRGKVHLIQAGWFANDAIEQAFRQGAKELCPSVNAIFLDGRKPEVRSSIWAAADIFVSFSDNVQETFGLTPIEAMAAGLPSVVSDWDGYMDTVRHGEDGFRVPTWQPPAPLGEAFAYRHALGLDTYDNYCGKCSQFVAVDVPATCETVIALAGDPELRRKMGASARQRAREIFDWRVVIGQYQALWGELARLRNEAPESAPIEANSAPYPARMDPFAAFAHYPTHVLKQTSSVAPVAESGDAALDRARALQMSAYAAGVHPDRDGAAKLLEHLARFGETGVGALLRLVPTEKRRDFMRGLVWLAKHNLVRLLPAKE